MPDSLTSAAGASAASRPPPSARTERSAPDARMAEESFAIHTRYGGEYMDENPITGKPGEFHLSSTGRKDMKLTVPVIGGPAGAGVALPVLKTLPDNSPLGKDAKPEKAGRAGAPPKPKRRKSKGGSTTPS